jgi:hypothetical protein
LVRFLEREFGGLKEGSSAVALREILEKNAVVMQKISEVYLFFDTNYYNNQLLKKLREFALRTVNA